MLRYDEFALAFSERNLAVTRQDGSLDVMGNVSGLPELHKLIQIR